MTLWQTSLTYQIWVWLCDVYEDSTLHRFLAAAGRWCSGQIEGEPHSAAAVPGGDRGPVLEG